jgi:CBS domain-containing protein
VAENITARDLMLKEHASIPSDRSLGEALASLVELQKDASRANVLVAVDAEGQFEGIVTAHLLCKSLLSLWMPAKSLREDSIRLEQELLAVVGDRNELKVHDTLIRGLPTVLPSARLLELIEAACKQRLAFVPVVEDGRALGLVPITAVFQAVAALALTPEDEGIHFD